MKRVFKFVVEKHADGCVAYPLGIEGGVAGQGDTPEEALTNAKSALAFHIETFGSEVIKEDSPVLDAFVMESELALAV